jgi:alkylation response protein AidB-like acyl-CoA dehydrogenase
MMDLRFSPEQESFRSEVRQWMAAHVPTEAEPTDRAALIEYQRAWQAELAKESFVAVHFPSNSVDAAWGGLRATWSRRRWHWPGRPRSSTGWR